MISSNIRVPEEIWERIRELAEYEKRSINSEIIFILQKHIEEQQKKH